MLLLQRVERSPAGTGEGKVKAPPARGRLRQAHGRRQDFDPGLGDDDGTPTRRSSPSTNPATTWTTESFPAARRYAGKDESAYYVTPPQGVAPPDRDRHPEDGLREVEIHVPRRAAPRPTAARRAATGGRGGTVKRKRQRFKLRTDGERYRYYLVWITKLPEGAERVEISDVSLFRRDVGARQNAFGPRSAR